VDSEDAEKSVDLVIPDDKPSHIIEKPSKDGRQNRHTRQHRPHKHASPTLESMDAVNVAVAENADTSTDNTTHNTTDEKDTQQVHAKRHHRRSRSRNDVEVSPVTPERSPEHSEASELPQNGQEKIESPKGGNRRKRRHPYQRRERSNTRNAPQSATQGGEKNVPENNGNSVKTPVPTESKKPITIEKTKDKPKLTTEKVQTTTRHQQTETSEAGLKKKTRGWLRRLLDA
jgi:hypothetical protein